MAALVIDAPSTVTLTDVPVPGPQPGQCIIRTSYVGLCGTDAALFDGTSSYLHTGAMHYPFVFGHEWSGTVVAAADDVRAYTPGDRVVGYNVISCDTCRACRTGHRVVCENRIEVGVFGNYPGAASTYFAVPAKVLAPIPECLSDRDAALLEPGTTALHAVTRARVREEDAVLVFGTGTLGLITVQLCVAFGATVDVIGVEEAGLALARQFGARATLAPADAPENTYDVVIEASGSLSAGAQVPHVLRDGGRVALIGVAHTPIPNFHTVPLVLKNAEVHGVLSGIEQWDRLIALVGAGKVDLGRLVESEFPPARAADAFALLGSRDKSRPKVMINFRDQEDRQW
ncbi:zinc-dependent alcohol dehydrogenase [Nocardia carnea]|uniref:zinc-dependent alcohol dehydrogenase n=1 Tax=Nocardia carnea TaxID=37328 RepID=UPI0024570D7A|nr:alcohol dehydrogenase catalytic domain-containing protein [Nocardia carnea]